MLGDKSSATVEIHSMKLPDVYHKTAMRLMPRQQIVNF
jgi:hypothetical protein